MKVIQYGFSLVLYLLVFHQSTSFASTLELSKEFEAIAVNGQLSDSGLFSSQSSVPLRTGLNRIAIRFEEVYEGEDDDNFDIIKSNLFVIEFYAAQDTDYRQLVTRPANADAARRYVKNPLFNIINNNNRQTTDHTITPLSSNNDDFAIAKTRPNKNRSIMISNQPKSQKITHSDKAALGKTSQATQMLEYWWQQATEAERKAFLESIK